MLKDDPPEQLIAAIRTVAAGDALLSPAITKRVIEQFARMPRPTPPTELDELTERELEVFRLIARGLSNAEIGQELYISETTVKTHVTHILQKLDLRDRVQAVVLAYQEGSSSRTAPDRTHASRRSSSPPRAPRELVLHERRVEPARGEEHVRVEPQVGDLGDETLVALGGTGESDLDSLFADLARGGRRAAREQACDVRALRAARSRARRPAPEPRREARHRSRMARRPGGAYAQQDRVAVAVLA